MMLEAGVNANAVSCNTVIKASAFARAEHWMYTMLKAGIA